MEFVIVFVFQILVDYFEGSPVVLVVHRGQLFFFFSG